MISRYPLPEKVRAIFEKEGITKLFPPQSEALEKGVLEGKNLLMAVPTAAGKTFIAEVCMLKSILENNGHCLYIVPLKALACEKYEDFKRKYSSLGIKIEMATGDIDTPEKSLSNCQILIATAEKIDSLLRSKAPWLINSLNVIVLDEIHFINDGSRGPTLEILTARIKQLNPQAQIIALSATVSNAREIADWLEADLVTSNWRPIPLKEGVYWNKAIQFHNSPTRLIKEESRDDLNKLTLDTLRGKGQVIIFVNSRRSAQAASRQVSKSVSLTLTTEEKHRLALIAKKITGSQADSTKTCRKLGEAIMHGTAFHHAGLRPSQRKLIEESFKKNLIKVICSTPTLATGVNLPARRAIIRDCKRFERGLGAAYIPTSEYKQCAGRAGRPQYDEYGEAVLVAKSYSESKSLFSRYIDAEPEPVTSKLNNESALRVHILASIAGGYLHDINGTLDFISHTFMAHQKQAPNLIETIGDIFDFLQEEGFIEKEGFHYHATSFGRATSRLYVDPLSSIILRKGLKKIEAGKSFSNIGLLHLLGCCPDSPLLSPRKNELEDLGRFASGCQEEFVLDSEDLPVLDDLKLYLSIVKTTMLLSCWIDEEKEEMLCEEFNIGPGDLYRHIETTRWLLYAGIVFADLFHLKKLTFLLGNLKARVHYGIKEELLQLVRLKGVGRVRARNLYKKGFHDISALKHTSLEKLSLVDKIGKTLAQEILKQVSVLPRSSP